MHIGRLHVGASTVVDLSAGLARHGWVVRLGGSSLDVECPGCSVFVAHPRVDAARGQAGWSVGLVFVAVCRVLLFCGSGGLLSMCLVVVPYPVVRGDVVQVHIFFTRGQVHRPSMLVAGPSTPAS